MQQFDPGTPPSTTTEQQERIEALVRGSSLSDMDVSDPNALGAPISDMTEMPAAVPEQSPSIPAASVASAPGSVIARPKKLERVELEYIPATPNVPGFKLAFTVGEVCVREHYLSLWIITDIGFKPTDTMRFNLSYNGRVYPVIFAGAEFEFQSAGIRGISFLIEKKRPTNAENRTSSGR